MNICFGKPIAYKFVLENQLNEQICFGKSIGDKFRRKPVVKCVIPPFDHKMRCNLLLYIYVVSQIYHLYRSLNSVLSFCFQVDLGQAPKISVIFGGLTSVPPSPLCAYYSPEKLKYRKPRFNLIGRAQRVFFFNIGWVRVGY